MKKFEGEFSFINHDSRNLLPKSRRSQVHQHIQSVYHPWRVKHGGGEAGFETYTHTRARLALGKDSSKPADIVADEIERIRRGYGLSLLRPRLREIRRKPDNSQKVEISPPARTILQKGNSDPFNSMPFDISSNISNILGSYQVFFVPFGLPPERRAIDPMAGKKQFEEAFKHALHDPLQSRALFTATMTVLARESRNQKLQIQALYHKDRLLKVLQKRLSMLYANENESSAFAIQLTVVLMYSIEFEFDQLSAANIHAKALGLMMSQYTSPDSVNSNLLEAILSLDEAYIVLCPQRSYFSFPEWNLMPLVDTLKPYIGHKPNLSSTIFPYPLLTSANFAQTAWQDLKEVIVLDGYLYTLQYLIDYHNFRLFHIRRFICQSRMLNQFYDLNDLASSSDQPDTTRLRFQAALTIAAVYYSRFLYRHCSYLRRRNFVLDSLVDAIRRVYLLQDDHLTEHTWSASDTRPTASTFLADSLEADPQHVSEMWLWILYVGAQVGHMNSASPNVLSSLFTNQARAMGIENCDELKAILGKFLYSDDILPRLVDWWTPVQTDLMVPQNSSA